MWEEEPLRGLWVCLGRTAQGKGNCLGPRVGLAPGPGTRAGQRRDKELRVVLALRGHHLAAVPRVNPIILQVAFSLETFPAVSESLGLAILPWWPLVGSHHILAGGMETPSGNRSAFSFLGNFSRILLPSSMRTKVVN